MSRRRLDLDRTSPSPHRRCTATTLSKPAAGRVERAPRPTFANPRQSSPATASSLARLWCGFAYSPRHSPALRRQPACHRRHRAPPPHFVALRCPFGALHPPFPWAPCGLPPAVGQALLPVLSKRRACPERAQRAEGPPLLIHVHPCSSVVPNSPHGPQGTGHRPRSATCQRASP